VQLHLTTNERGNIATKTTRKSAASKRPRPQRFKLIVEAQPMIVRFTPNYMTGGYPCGHFEFSSPHKPARRIPVSTTGYWSHFAPMDEVEEADSPEDYARLLAVQCIEGKCRRHVSNREPTLFGLLDQ
jgi:hypothetical protein